MGGKKKIEEKIYILSKQITQKLMAHKFEDMFDVMFEQIDQYAADIEINSV